MSFDRSLLPDPFVYFSSQGLSLQGPASGQWRTTACIFHGGTDSMRVNIRLGCWVCMNCGEKGGDVLAYEMKSTGCSFYEAVKGLGCWAGGRISPASSKPTPFSPRMALSVLKVESTLVSIAAGNVGTGVELSEEDRARLMVAKNRIDRLVEVFA